MRKNWHENMRCLDIKRHIKCNNIKYNLKYNYHCLSIIQGTKKVHGRKVKFLFHLRKTFISIEVTVDDPPSKQNRGIRNRQMNHEIEYLIKRGDLRIRPLNWHGSYVTCTRLWHITRENHQRHPKYTAQYHRLSMITLLPRLILWPHK